MGADACPSGYTTVTDAVTCAAASVYLGDPYEAHNNDGASNAICNGRACGAAYGQGNGCENTRLTGHHGAQAQWICKQAGCATSSKHVCI